MTDSRADSAFHDLDAYLALPRLTGLTLSADGTRLVTSVATLDSKRTDYTSALWEIDPTGRAPARRLTRSRRGESEAAFTADGDLLFLAARPDPEQPAEPGEEPVRSLWLLPADGAEARLVAARAAGLGGLRTAATAPVALLASDVLPRAADAADDERRRKERKEKKVTAILHATYPIRYWDRDLGPAAPHLFAARLDTGPDEPVAGRAEPRLDLRDLTPDAPATLTEQSADISADGRTVVATWRVPAERGTVRDTLIAVDVESGERRVLVDDPDGDLSAPVVSPDGRQVAYQREARCTPEQAVRFELWVADLATGQRRQVAAGWDRWPHDPLWARNGAALYVVADDGGRAPVFRIDLRTDVVARITADDAAFSDLRLSPDGATLYALRTSYAAPPHPVRIDVAAAASSGGPVPATPLRGPAPLPALPGTLTEVEATADDGQRIRSWLALPAAASAADPAPLLLWIHGGPLGSWKSWSWRWNPWLMVARGYAVLLPDPALSTGYGQDFIQRGWGQWGGKPYTDLMAATDAALARDDIDSTRTAAMGGSYGGYMANWIAGHTDRFDAIVTHASIWSLDQFAGTTDAAYFSEREMTAEQMWENSPHRLVERIVTPILVIHGDRDYRVPIGEGLRLWRDLLAYSGRPAGADGATPHRFLYFPDENHWVLRPQHAKIWYQAVTAFLVEHVLGEKPAELPEVLG